jgi:hypothetical protein
MRRPLARQRVSLANFACGLSLAEMGSNLRRDLKEIAFVQTSSAPIDSQSWVFKNSYA